MKKYNLILVMLLAFVMVFMFVGCDGDDGGSTTPTPTPTPGGPEEGGPEEGVWNLAALKAVDGGLLLKVGGDSAPTYDSTSKVVTVTANGSSMFYIDFEDVDGLEVAAGDKLVVTYVCFVEATPAKVIVKNGKNSWNDFSPAIYTSFENTPDGPVDLAVDITATSATDGLSFQHNVDGAGDAKYHVKILSVGVAEEEEDEE